MNYAEDRLDRKARHANTDDSSAKASNPLEDDLLQANQYFQGEEIISKYKGHELAGRTYRDAGLMPQATFHYGMAWIMSHYCNDEILYTGSDDHNDENVGGIKSKAAGDYAQVVELAGFPEIGVLSLFYHSLDGSLQSEEGPCTCRPSQGHTNIFITMDEFRQKIHSAYGTAACTASPCFVPSEMSSSELFWDIVKSLQSLEDTVQKPSCEKYNAADLLESVSKATQKKNPIIIQPSTPSHIPSKLQFWQEIPHGEKKQYRLSPLLQILLLKILYSSPIGSAFLHLACEAVRHLSISLPIASKLGRRMAQTHKSHWAYYILIYKVVLGERVKKHRRGTEVPYHYPVWDIIHSLDHRSFDGFQPEAYLLKENAGIGVHLTSIIDFFSKNSFEGDQAPPQLNIPVCLPRSALSNNYIFAIGDSHVLSIGWQTIRIARDRSDIYRTIVPYPITGLKAWHIREGTNFFTKSNLDCCLRRLPNTCKSIILSAGEIDCREGIGGTLLEGYYNGCDDAVRNTVMEYVSAVRSVACKHDLQILLLPVAPHAYRSGKNGKSLGRGLRRKRMLLWNDTIRDLCAQESIRHSKRRCFLLDYEKDLREKNEESPVGFVLNKHYNADFTHMNSAFLPRLEKAIVQSDCDLKLL